MTYTKDQVRKVEEIYKEFESELKEIVDGSIIPSLDNLDIFDVIFYFEYYFNGTDDYESKMENLLEESEIKLTKKSKEKVFNISKSYITQLKTILKI